MSAWQDLFCRGSFAMRPRRPARNSGRGDGLCHEMSGFVMIRRRGPPGARRNGLVFLYSGTIVQFSIPANPWISAVSGPVQSRPTVLYIVFFCTGPAALDRALRIFVHIMFTKMDVKPPSARPLPCRPGRRAGAIREPALSEPEGTAATGRGLSGRHRAPDVCFAPSGAACSFGACPPRRGRDYSASAATGRSAASCPAGRGFPPGLRRAPCSPASSSNCARPTCRSA